MATVRPCPHNDIELSNLPEDSTVMMNAHNNSSKWLMLLYCDFPLFTDESIHGYDEYCRKNVNPIVFSPSFFVFFALVFCRCGLVVFDRGAESYLVGIKISAIVTYLLCLFFFGLYCSVHFLRLTGRDHMFIALTARLKKWLPGRLEDWFLFPGICAWSLFLIARVLQGQCPTDTTLWQQQTCNPFANNGGIPTELAYVLYVMPLVGQLVMRSVSIPVLTICYFLCFGAVAFCVFYSKSNDYSVLFNVLFFMNASFEITRLQRVSYVEMLKAKRHEKIALAQLKHEQDIQEVIRAQELMLHRAEDEKRLKESEAVQLRR